MIDTFLTIITPTYNRANTMLKCYESLLNQTCYDFKWIIIDDGSCDNTEAVVENFSRDEFNIIYEKKENGGKHSALNFAYKYISNELVLILDSDDYLEVNAVEKIRSIWSDNNYNDGNIVGMSFLRKDSKNNIIGDKFPKTIYLSDYVECRINEGISGDKAEVFRADVLKRNPFPIYENEKFIGEDVIWIKLGLEYKTIHVNEAIYTCEYLEDGLTKSGRKLRINCPCGGIERAKVYFNKKIKLKVRFKMMIQYICYGIFAKKKLFKDLYKALEYDKILFFLSMPFGMVLFLYWTLKYKN